MTVTTPGGGPTSPPLTFTYRDAPTVGVDPAVVGSVHWRADPGDDHRHRLRHRRDDGDVRRRPATFVTVLGDTQLTLTTPPGTAGLANIVVITAGGPSAPAPIYTYVDAPTATAINPTSGPVAGGTSVTITGTNFLAGQTVDPGRVPQRRPRLRRARPTSRSAAGARRRRSTRWRRPSPVTRSLRVDARRDSDPLTFTYLPIPTATAISPDSGPLSGGAIARVTINGTGFVDGQTTVEFDESCRRRTSWWPTTGRPSSPTRQPMRPVRSMWSSPRLVARPRR